MTALLITDGDCEFCQRTAGKLAKLVPSGWTNVPSNSVPSAELKDKYGLTPADLAHSVWLVEFAGIQTIKYSGAKAVGKVFRMRSGFWSLVGWLTFIPPTSWVAAGLYRLVANDRKFFSRFV